MRLFKLINKYVPPRIYCLCERNKSKSIRNEGNYKVIVYVFTSDILFL